MVAKHYPATFINRELETVLMAPQPTLEFFGDAASGRSLKNLQPPSCTLPRGNGRHEHAHWNANDARDGLSTARWTSVVGSTGGLS